MSPLLSLEQVSFSIGGSLLTSNVSFALSSGERVALMGPNGAGKTTLMHLVSGVYVPSSGMVRLGENDVTRWPSHRRARAGLARTFQVTNLLPTRTVEENIAIAVGADHPQRVNPLRPWRRMHSVWDRTDELIADAGLDGVRTSRVDSLPYGEQRRLEIVVAVARPASVVMLDEPGAGLTAVEAEALIELVFSLGSDRAVLFVDHDVELVRRLATRMLLLDLGRIVADGTPDDVVRSDQFGRIYVHGGARA